MGKGSKRQECSLVLIEWVDSAQPRAKWEFLASLTDTDSIKCASVGWLVSDGKRNKCLAPNMGALNDPGSLQVSGVITIPTKCITKITRLKEPLKRSTDA